MTYHWRSAAPSVLTRYLYVGAPAGSGVTWDALQLQDLVAVVIQHCGSHAPEETTPAKPAAVSAACSADRTSNEAECKGSSRRSSNDGGSSEAEPGSGGGSNSISSHSTPDMPATERYSGCYFVFHNSETAQAALSSLHTAAGAAVATAAHGTASSDACHDEPHANGVASVESSRLTHTAHGSGSAHTSSTANDSRSVAKTALLRLPQVDIPLVVGFAERRLRQPPQVLPVASSSAESLGIPGLFLLRDFVTAAEEQALLAAVDAAEWVCLARRRVQHYGYAFEYAARSINVQSPLGPLPSWAAAVGIRIEALPSVAQSLDQLTVNEYEPGVGLSSHIDTHSAFTGAIVSLSLAGSAAMELRRGDTKHLLALPPRSLLVLSGESRYAWQHMIPHRKADVVDGQLVSRQPRRVSLTFRQVRGAPCTCPYPQHCDSQASTLPPTRLAQLQATQASGTPSLAASGQHSDCTTGSSAASHASPICVSAVKPPVQDGLSGRGQQPAAMSEQQLCSLEAEYVHRVYDAIAPHFSSTRFSIWPKVRAFMQSLAPGSLVADVGCGNGKYFNVRSDVAVLGSDRSSGLAHVAAAQLQSKPDAPKATCSKADVLIADGMALPYQEGSFDAALCIAVLHHISSPARRLRLLQQLVKVLRVGGRALVTVWAAEQEDPAKTLHKWHRIDVQPKAASVSAYRGPLTSGAASRAEVGAASQHASSTAAVTPGEVVIGAYGPGNGQESGSNLDLLAIPAPTRNGACVMGDASGRSTDTVEPRLDGGDYFVPWHLPVHRDEGKRALLAVQSAVHSQNLQPQVDTQDAETIIASSGAHGRNLGPPSIEDAKGVVVFQRYYHLFECGELQLLAAGLGTGAQVVDSFYDRSNWCIILERRG